MVKDRIGGADMVGKNIFKMNPSPAHEMIKTGLQYQSRKVYLGEEI